MVHLYVKFKFFVLKTITHFLSPKIGVERSNVGLSKAISVGVLYGYETPTKHDSVQRFIRALKNLDKKVSVLCYTTAQDRLFPSSNLLYSFGNDSITLFGKVTNERVKRFIDTPFDYLFHVDVTTNPVLDYIVAKNQAKCRVGHFDPVRKALFEVMVKVDGTTTEDVLKRLTGQMLHYTQCMVGE